LAASGDWQTLRTNIRQTVASGVGRAGGGLPGDVNSERIGGAEPGPFADQNGDQIGAEKTSDFVADHHPAGLDDGHRGGSNQL
jgi:hypothetical protein